MPNHGTQPAAQAASPAISGEFRKPCSVYHPCAVELNVDTVDNILRVHVRLRQMSGDTLKIGPMLLIKFPPGTLVPIRTCDREKEIVAVDLGDQFCEF